MENMSRQGGVIDNGISTGNPQVTAPAGPGPFVGTGSEMPYKNKGSGYEGPGRGNLTKLASDDQMPVNCSYGC